MSDVDLQKMIKDFIEYRDQTNQDDFAYIELDAQTANFLKAFTTNISEDSSDEDVISFVTEYEGDEDE
jgi:hypothetical protein